MARPPGSADSKCPMVDPSVVDVLAHNWAVHMHSPNVVPRTDFEGHTTSGVNNL